MSEFDGCSLKSACDSQIDIFIVSGPARREVVENASAEEGAM
jgi:hypothetical protein